MGLILVKNHVEEEMLYKLLKEFGGKVILPRAVGANETYKKFAAKGVFGVLGVDYATTDEDTTEAIYELALPDHYSKFIAFVIQEQRDKVYLLSVTSS